ncbi:MAG: CDP-2,3-bis-(O-geranylgeranyl)-sn-glycerol synthase [Promethearchaeota archaeon]
MNGVIVLIIDSIIFIFPAFVANAAPTILGKGKRFNGPIDGGRLWKDNKRILGDGKTIRGFVSGVFCGMLTCVAIIILGNYTGYPLVFMTYMKGGLLYNVLKPLDTAILDNMILLGSLIGFLLGCGALIGDIIGSFIKRRSGLKRGESYPLMDQLGFLVTALILVYLVIPWPVIWLIFLVPISLGLHISLNLLSYVAGVQEVPL